MNATKKKYEELLLQMHLLEEDVVTASSNFDDNGNVEQDDFFE